MCVNRYIDRVAVSQITQHLRGIVWVWAQRPHLTRAYTTAEEGEMARAQQTRKNYVS